MTTDLETFPYRNTANGHVGYVTHEQAAVFPDLLEFVEDYVDPSTIDEDEPAPTPAPAAPAKPAADPKAVK